MWTPVTTTVTPKPAICRVSTGDEKNRFLGSSPDLINPSAQSLFIGCSLCLGISISQPGLGTTGLEHLTACPVLSAAARRKEQPFLLPEMDPLG